MHSSNSNENIAKDVSILVTEHETLRKMHNKLARSTSKALGSVAELGESIEKRQNTLAKRIFWLCVSQIAVLCYLIFVL